jgi:hypothetical protein
VESAALPVADRESLVHSLAATTSLAENFVGLSPAWGALNTALEPLAKRGFRGEYQYVNVRT